MSEPAVETRSVEVEETGLSPKFSSKRVLGVAESPLEEDESEKDMTETPRLACC